MKEQVILQRRQPTDFIINYPYGENGNKEYKFLGTKGNRITERPIPMDVFEWLTQYTTTISGGELVIKETEIKDEDIMYTRDSIENIEAIEKSALTIEEVKTILETGNHNVLKKALKELVDGKPDNIIRAIKKQVVTIAGEIGIDSSAKRKVVCEWADIDFEISDVIFDKNVEALHS